MPNTIVNRCEFQVGETIDNRYLVGKFLGEGSFGKVFLVTDPEKRIFALKLLKLWEIPAEIRQPLILRFDMEFQTGQIDSNYLVHSVSHGQVQGNPYIIMEYCPGGDLAQFIGSTQTSMCRESKEILLGLGDLHSHGKVHRDLKPENVLFKKNGIAALTDFGISGDRNKRMTERNIFGKPQQIFGTYAYMPPEQVNRSRGEATVLPTTDLFSFGVMLFHLLTGELPFGELNTHNDLVKYQRNGKEGKWNRNKIRKLPNGKDWETVIEGCLVPDFRQRVQTAKEVIRLLPERNGFEKEYDVEPDFQTGQTKGMQLKIMQGEEFGKTYQLSDLLTDGKRMFTIGRENTNTLWIKETQSAYISRFHCTIETDAEQKHWFIRDGQWKTSDRCWQESTNGTYVNSIPVTPGGLEFKSGDIISIGDVKLKVERQ
jgi:serine/threonine protein kinase